VICGPFGAPNGFRDTSPRSQAFLDIFLIHDLCFPTMVGWVNRHNDAHSAIAVKNEIPFSGIPFSLMGEMLQDGGTPWRGMVYGMTNRLPWSGQNPARI